MKSQLKKDFKNFMKDTYTIRILLLESGSEDSSYFNEIFRNIEDVELETVRVENVDRISEFISLESYDLIFIGPSLLKLVKKVDIDRIEQQAKKTGAGTVGGDLIPNTMAAVYAGNRAPEQTQRLLKEVMIWVIGDARARSKLNQELRRRQRMLEASEARFEKIIEKNADGIIIVNKEGLVLYLNPAAEELFDKTSEELIGNDFGFPLVGGSSTEIDIIRKDRQLRMAEMRAVEIKMQAEEAFLVSLRDITERKKIEQQLQKSRDELKLIASQIPVAIWTIDKNLTFTNFYGTGMTKYMEERIPKMIGKTLYWYFETDDSNFEPIAAHISALKGIQAKYERVAEIILDATVKPLRDNEGNIIGAVGVGVDITDRKNMERELFSRNKELNDFAYMVSHDLKAPLNIMAGFIDLLKGHPDKYDDIMEEVYKQVKHLSYMIDTLLKFSRAGRMIENKKDVDLNKLINEVFLSATTMIEDAELVIQNPIPVIKGDRLRMEQIFQNIIINALENRNPDKPKCIITVDWKMENNRLLLKISDNGKGIKPENLSKVFEPNFTTKKREGSGFGLTITYKLVEAHGGRIWVTSKGENQGATFYIDLPVK